MTTQDVKVLDVVARTRLDAWRETRWLGLHVVLAAIVVVVAAAGLPGIASAVLWVLAGVVVADTVSLAGRVWETWRELRRLTRCSDCRVLAAAVDAAWDSYQDRRGEHTGWGA